MLRGQKTASTHGNYLVTDQQSKISAIDRQLMGLIWFIPGFADVWQKPAFSNTAEENTVFQVCFLLISPKKSMSQTWMELKENKLLRLILFSLVVLLLFYTCSPFCLRAQVPFSSCLLYFLSTRTWPFAVRQHPTLPQPLSSSTSSISSC